ncbi:putative RNA-binding protein [Trypanosoma theileri]|uniref:Putative RNA-binding protein n=1 Tax=Trypanosoma theileri TaxID=67003 RepID=A0A1X0NVB2_9TRYP|nr:putative RNA-binding protein [Trypanosoma theileri]ORC88644.1 putative RNA-binding protein [Trypanosoma theileri]
MPSRAVLRKKARRESKRNKRDAEAATAVKLLTPQKEQQEQQQPQKEQKEQQQKQQLQMSEVGKVKNKEGVAVVSRKRVRAAVESTAAETVPSTEGMTRKERKRFEAKRRLERQLLRLNAGMPTENTTDTNNNTNTNSNDNGIGTEAEGEEVAAAVAAETTTHITDANGASSPASGTLRHDPKFANGTFWRTRKERRQRTVFLGNVPIQFTEQNVMDLVSTAVDAEGVAGRVVEAVDFLPAKPRARQRHMFVTLCTKEIASQVVGLLNAYKLAGSELRCNFAADKAQRSEAISRRSGNTVRS